MRTQTLMTAREAAKRAQGETAVGSSVPAELLAFAEKRRVWLGRWWAAIQVDAGRCGIVKTAERLIAAIKSEEPSAEICVSSLYRWQRLWRARGLYGLVDGRQAIADHVRTHRVAPGFIRLSDRLVSTCGDQLTVLAALGLAYSYAGPLGGQAVRWYVWKYLIGPRSLTSAKRLSDALAAWLVTPFLRQLGGSLEAVCDRVDAEAASLAASIASEQGRAGVERPLSGLGDRGLSGGVEHASRGGRTYCTEAVLPRAEDCPHSAPSADGQKTLNREDLQ